MARMRDALMLRHKWLAFRALQGRFSARDASAGYYGAHLALLTTAMATAVVCAFNDQPFRYSSALGMVAHACFCLLVAGLYGVYAIVTQLHSLVQSCVEEPSLGGNGANYYYVTGGGEEEEEPLGSVGEADGEEGDDPRPRRRNSSDGGVHMLPREVIVSSMYLGGMGIFLAISPLCMWDCAVTLAFIITLFLISAMDRDGVPKERRLYALYASLTIALSISIAIEVTMRMPHFLSKRMPVLMAYLRPSFFSSWTQNMTRLSSSSSSSSSEPVLGENDEMALRLAQMAEPPVWPFLLLSCVSPIFLRAGGGGVLLGRLFHSMSPVQTMETGLPVCTLIAALTLSAFGSLDTAVLHSETLFRAPGYWYMVAVAPIGLTGSIAFLIYALRRRAAVISVAILLFVLIIRQQLMRDEGATPLDIAGVTFASASLLLAMWCMALHSSSSPSALFAPAPHLTPSSSLAQA